MDTDTFSMLHLAAVFAQQAKTHLGMWMASKKSKYTVHAPNSSAMGKIVSVQKSNTDRDKVIKLAEHAAQIILNLQNIPKCNLIYSIATVGALPSPYIFTGTINTCRQSFPQPQTSLLSYTISVN